MISCVPNTIDYLTPDKTSYTKVKKKNWTEETGQKTPYNWQKPRFSGFFFFLQLHWMEELLKFRLCRNLF